MTTQPSQPSNKVDSQLLNATHTHKVGTHNQQQLSRSAQHGEVHMQDESEQLGSRDRHPIKRSAGKGLQPQPEQKPASSTGGVQRKGNRIIGGPCACCGCTRELQYQMVTAYKAEPAVALHRFCEFARSMQGADMTRVEM